MLSRLLVVLYFVFGIPFIVARPSTSQAIICVPGQCLQGFSNLTLGETISAQGDTSVQLLPGQYTSTTTPQLLHIILTSSSAKLSLSPGYNSSSVNPLPLNIALQPGIAMYSNALFAGQAAFSDLPSIPINSSIPLPASSLALSNNVWAALTSGSSRIIFWNSVPDVSQLPPAVTLPLALVDIQSSACSPPCSSSTVCSASAKCVCPPGFTGSSCESCAEGFFGPTCKPCPSQCQLCDQGTSGSGRCFVPIVGNTPATCNCLNGLCGTKGNCTCNPGWTKADNGTACAQCAPGFFLTSAGDCQICQLGCTQCADGTGNCIACKHGFSQNENDKTLCDALASLTSSGTPCPDGSYNAGDQCAACSPSCSTCNGPSSNNCIICASGSSLFQGSCVAVDSNGVCAGSGGMIADNNKGECDACGAKCTSCKIPNFNTGSLASQRQCTKCLPGFFLSKGQCLGNCSSGSFVSPKDNLTCTTCSTSCNTCLGSADFCLTCPNQQLASSGQCVSTCPAGTFSASGACLKCHPDCQSCTGESFNQCSACPASRPVLSSGRCLPTCGQSKFFDLTSSGCLDCDSSCSSCSGSGSSNCLACSNSNQILRAGSCVSANCTGSTNVIPGLGVCLSELVQVPNSTNTNTTTTTTSNTISSSSSSAPIPSNSSSATGSTVLVNGHKVPWWQILLIVLGGVIILVLILMLWRWRARRKRAEETVMFASAKQIDGTDGWRWRLKQVRNILFGGKKGGRDVDDSPMASYGDKGVSHRHRNLDLDYEFRSPTVDQYLDDALSPPYPSPKSIHRLATKSKPLPSTRHRFRNRSPTRGYRSNDPSPTREYRSDDRSPTRGYRSDNRSPTREYRVDDRYPTRVHRSDNRSPTREYRVDDRYPTRVHRSDNRSPTREYRVDDRYPTRVHRSDNRSPSRRYRSDDPSTRGYRSAGVRSPTTSHRPPQKHEDRWDDRLDNSLSRYPRRDGKSGGSSHFLSPPPSYPSQSEHGRASLAVLR